MLQCNKSACEGGVVGGDRVASTRLMVDLGIQPLEENPRKVKDNLASSPYDSVEKVSGFGEKNNEGRRRPP